MAGAEFQLPLTWGTWAPLASLTHAARRAPGGLRRGPPDRGPGGGPEDGDTEAAKRWLSWAEGSGGITQRGRGPPRPPQPSPRCPRRWDGLSYLRQVTCSGSPRTCHSRAPRGPAPRALVAAELGGRWGQGSGADGLPLRNPLPRTPAALSC
ncbi:hypothetical protein GH733_017638 [Mirounga leonina]|nr:hypothetical protein GH733_017638 [Mirounga leonina]